MFIHGRAVLLNLQREMTPDVGRGISSINIYITPSSPVKCKIYQYKRHWDRLFNAVSPPNLDRHQTEVDRKECNSAYSTPVFICSLEGFFKHEEPSIKYLWPSITKPLTLKSKLTFARHLERSEGIGKDLLVGTVNWKEKARGQRSDMLAKLKNWAD